MITDEQEKALKSIASIAIEGIKKLSSEKVRLNSESLYSAMREFSEVNELVTSLSEKSDN